MDVLDWDDFNLCLMSFVRESKNPDLVFSKVGDAIYEQADRYHYKLQEYGWSWQESYVDNLVKELTFFQGTGLMLKYLCGLEDGDKTRKLLGIIVDDSSFPEVINSLRNYFNETKDRRATGVGRVLIGADPDDESVDFFT
jgi:hypothetical protein